MPLSSRYVRIPSARSGLWHRGRLGHVGPCSYDDGGFAGGTHDECAGGIDMPTRGERGDDPMVDLTPGALRRAARTKGGIVTMVTVLAMVTAIGLTWFG